MQDCPEKIDYDTMEQLLHVDGMTSACNNLDLDDRCNNSI